MTSNYLQKPSATFFSDDAISVLRQGNILQYGESPEEMVTRVLSAVFEVEAAYSTPAAERIRMRNSFSNYMAEKIVTLGSPILTNAGINENPPLSSCVAIPVDLREDFSKISAVIESYYHQNMGSGYNFSDIKDPVSMVKRLNEHAKIQTEAALHRRYIGNMGNLDIDHPQIEEFIRLKAETSGLVHFNLSVNVTDAFMDALQNKKAFLNKNGKAVDPTRIWQQIVQASWKCGDPGLLFLERFNDDNPTPLLGSYTTTAPCAEVGLAQGESCVFGYINLGALVTKGPDQTKKFNFHLLEEVVPLLTRVLDNCLEVSLKNYPTVQSAHIMGQKRKIGIGVCGYADLLGHLHLSYGSNDANKLLQEILITINYVSKESSIQLAIERGSFPHLPFSSYTQESGFIDRKYGSLQGLRITPNDWSKLENLIKNKKLLRHSSTTALPPSGRSALILDASTSVEPWFSLTRKNTISDAMKLDILDNCGNEASIVLDAIACGGSCQNSHATENTKAVYKKALEIEPRLQIEAIAKALVCIDEGASKTVNLRADTTMDQIDEILTHGWQSGLKAISIYRENSIQ